MRRCREWQWLPCLKGAVSVVPRLRDTSDIPLSVRHKCRTLHCSERQQFLLHFFKKVENKTTPKKLQIPLILKKSMCI